MQRSKGTHAVKSSHRAVRRKAGAVTIDDVAAHAGLSAMTVSRVINGHAGVRDDNRERVMRSVR
ncbi:LacI family DNA-binding transcriptional regulator, partial [Stenotrophomonas sp.]|uniref:LacI family DNA-binding transcriptional regulator n=1 Tax=Stenotrophomonas sp. TaxID=69392 RepID=UPI00198DC069